MISSNNRRIARNTIMLYFRMMVTMIISFYTTRVVLEALGVVDYGLVNVIGSAVSMFSFLSVSLSTSISRFLTYDLGASNPERLRRTFSLFLLIYVGLSFLLLVLAETVGLWVLKEKLIIPPERMSAAIVFFHFSVASLCMGVWGVPYTALLISHENMRAYAWLSIFDALAKLGIVFAVMIGDGDRLKLYGFLLFLVTILHVLMYQIFCYFCYEETHFSLFFQRKRFKEVLSFSGWSIFGTAAWASSDVFVNLLLNCYFGPVVNAARGIAVQISGATNMLTQNFLTAASPQVIKYWAAKEFEYFKVLVCRTARISFFLLFIISLPLLFETDFILKMWVKEPPDHTVRFAQIVIVTGLINSFSFPMVQAARATGRLAMFEGIGSGMRFIVLPLAWLFLKRGAPPESVFWSVFIGTIACVIVRLIVLSLITDGHCTVKSFVTEAVFPCLVVMITALAIPLVVRVLMQAGVVRFLTVGCISVASTLVAVFYFGLHRMERQIIVSSAFNVLEWSRRFTIDWRHG